MATRLTTATLIFVLFLVRTTKCQNPSPCPEIFTYEPRGTEDDRWYGVISLTTREDLSGVWLHVILDRPAELLGNWLGAATSTDNKEFTIKAPRYKLEAGPAVSVRIFVKYNTASTVPSLKGIRLNGKDICPTHQQESSRPHQGPTLHISEQVRPGATDGTSSSSRPGSSSSINNSRPHSSSGSSGSSGTNSRPTVTGGRPSSSSNFNNNEREENIGFIDSSEGSSSRPSSNQGTRRPSPAGSSSNSNFGVTNQRPSSSSSSSNFNQGRPSSGSNSGGGFNSQRPSSGSSSFNNEDNFNGGSGTSTSSFNQGRPTSSGTSSYAGDEDEDSDLPVVSSNTGNGLSIDENSSSQSSNNGFDFFPGDFALNTRPAVVRPQSRPSNPNKRNVKCGTVAMRASPLVSHGQNTSQGQFPWHAALYYSQGIQLMYTCGGTLISESHVITAAHCVAKPQTNRAINPQNILVYLGKYNLKKFGPEVQDREVSEIHLHPQYNHTVYFNDIAVLKLARPVDVTNYVRPCCLWEDDTELDSVMNKLGTVVGWGFDENRQLSHNLMQAQMPVVSTVTCIYSNREFFSQFTFEKNYCAGFRNGTSVCNGDSGGGMVFPKTDRSGQNTVWQIRGIVSVGVALQGQGVCDPRHYIVFTDVAKHLNWIKQTIND